MSYCKNFSGKWTSMWLVYLLILYSASQLWLHELCVGSLCLLHSWQWYKNCRKKRFLTCFLTVIRIAARWHDHAPWKSRTEEGKRNLQQGFLIVYDSQFVCCCRPPGSFAYWRSFQETDFFLHYFYIFSQGSAISSLLTVNGAAGIWLPLTRFLDHRIQSLFHPYNCFRRPAKWSEDLAMISHTVEW